MQKKKKELKCIIFYLYIITRPGSIEQGVILIFECRKTQSVMSVTWLFSFSFFLNKDYFLVIFDVNYTQNSKKFLIKVHFGNRYHNKVYNCL